MPASQAKLGYGTLLKRGDGATPEVFTAIAEVNRITPPSQDRPEVEVTHMESPLATREYIAGLKEPGQASFECNFLPSNPTQSAAAGVIADYQNGTVRNWQILYPDATLESFPAYPKNCSPAIVVDGALKMTVTLKLTGAVVWS